MLRQVALGAFACFTMINVVQAITEDDNEMTLRDANSTKDRPRIDGYDLNSDE